MKLLKNVHVLENNRQVRKEILFDETGILKIAEQIDAPEAEVIDGKEMTALPGLIDVHNHGNSNADFSDGSYEGLVKMARYLAKTGLYDAAV